MAGVPNPFDVLAAQGEDQAQDAVGRGMVRAHVDRHELLLEVLGERGSLDGALPDRVLAAFQGLAIGDRAVGWYSR